MKRSTIYFKPELHRALRIKAAETQRSVSDLVNDAVQTALREDKGEGAGLSDRVSEPTVVYGEIGQGRDMLGDTPKDILKVILALKPIQRAEIVDKILASLDQPDKDIDELWKIEVESRVEALAQGKMKTVSLEEVLGKYR